MRKQTGFTLIEIAIVLVIIGLLLGGVLKGQELITSARVRNLASTQDGIKAAFFGFQDRFRALPGDYTAATTNLTGVSTTAGCIGSGTATLGNGNGDGQITGAEAFLAWDHLSKAGFLSGSFTCGGATTVNPQTTPQNVYNAFLQIIFDPAWGTTGTSRHNIKTGAAIPVAIMAELDRKIDDGAPFSGSFQFSEYISTGTGGPTAVTCTSVATSAAGTATSTWLANSGQINCGGANLL
jgi:prepilin-type N-terminal cleavage/methylation domain-containing protein